MQVLVATAERLASILQGAAMAAVVVAGSTRVSSTPSLRL
jgi:hypothetical protein